MFRQICFQEIIETRLLSQGIIVMISESAEVANCYLDSFELLEQWFHLIFIECESLRTDAVELKDLATVTITRQNKDVQVAHLGYLYGLPKQSTGALAL